MTVEQINQNKTKEFFQRAEMELQALWISDETMSHIISAGCEVVGVRYFEKLFKPELPAEDRLASAYVGCVVHDKPEFAKAALDLFVLTAGRTQRAQNILVDALGGPAKTEHRLGRVSLEGKLRQASKKLGGTFGHSLRREAIPEADQAVVLPFVSQRVA